VKKTRLVLPTSHIFYISFPLSIASYLHSSCISPTLFRSFRTDFALNPELLVKLSRQEAAGTEPNQPRIQPRYISRTPIRISSYDSLRTPFTPLLGQLRASNGQHEVPRSSFHSFHVRCASPLVFITLRRKAVPNRSIQRPTEQHRVGAPRSAVRKPLWLLRSALLCRRSIVLHRLEQPSPVRRTSDCCSNCKRWQLGILHHHMG
jgi:hypothetical protein